jgi:uncharacterized Fe-S cluster-containing radical SAM superfamily protein
VFGLVNILSVYLGKMKNGYIFTPDEFIKIKGNSVEYWGLRDVEALRYIEDENHFEAAVDGRLEIFRTTNKVDITDLLEKFNDWKQSASTSFLAAYDRPENIYHSSVLLKRAISAAAAILLGIALSYSALALNRDRDDHLTWNAALAESTVKAFYGYKQKHPRGRHIAEADEKNAQLLGSLKSEYLARVKPHADQKAVASFGSLLESVAKDPHMTIYVRIRETRELDQSIIEKIKKITGQNPMSYDQALPVAKTDFRKGLIFENLKLAFNQQIKNADVAFELTDQPPDGAASIDVSYKVRSEEFYYNYFTSSGHGRQENIYPGAKFNFDFILQPGAPGEQYQTAFESFPKRLDGHAFRAEDSVNYSFDAVLFGVVSDNFRNFIQSKFGFIDITNS